MVEEDFLSYASDFLHVFCGAIGEDISVMQLRIFIEVSRASELETPICMKELEVIVGAASAATFSRQVLALTQTKKPQVPGLMLIDQVENPLDRRQKQLVLTKKGQRVAKKLTKVMVSCVRERCATQTERATG